MKILRLLNKNHFLIIFIFLLTINSHADDKPIDIWNINKEKIQKATNDESALNTEIISEEKANESSIFMMQSQKKNDEVQMEENIGYQDVKIIGLYDPSDYGLDINMWSNSDGDQLKSIFSKISKLNLSKDAAEIMNILILTNAYIPKKNISEKQFLKFKSDWLIKNADYDLIEEYLIKNQIFDLQPELSKFLMDYYLSNAEIEKVCEIMSKNTKPFEDEYLSKINIYCLIWSNKKDEAQIVYDLIKEAGFKEKYFDDKINYLLGFTSKINEKISEKSIFDFYLAHKTNPNFTFEPKDNTDKIIWKYLSSANLLSSLKEIQIDELDKIATIEKAVHDKNYPEKDLYDLYKRFQFNINQLLNAINAYKSLSNIEARALLYQKILLESETVERLKLLKILKESFKDDGLGNAFDTELKKFLENINPLDIPENLTSFYYTNIIIDKNLDKKIKFNKDVMHQSKLINYFNGDYSTTKIEKDVNSFLKKIKKNKKYFLSKKDIIFLESLKSDGIEIEKKYDDLYTFDISEVPTDLQVIINNNEKGAALLRIAEVIGQDDLEIIDEDTIFFIIITLNQLNIDQIRNKILLKVLPLKV